MVAESDSGKEEEGQGTVGCVGAWRLVVYRGIGGTCVRLESHAWHAPFRAHLVSVVNVFL